MRVSSIQLFTSELTDPKEFQLEPKIVHFDVCSIQDMKPARRKYRIYKSTNLMTERSLESLRMEDLRAGITSVFDEDIYLKFYDKFHDFSLELSRKHISKYKKLPVNTKKLWLTDTRGDEYLHKIPYIDVPNGCMIRIEREHEFRHIICNRDRIASHILDCMIYNKKEY